MRFIKTFIMPLLLIVVCGLLLSSAYVEVKNRAIDQLNNQQLVMAETAARGIESFFEHYTELLTQLSKMNQIASFDEQGRQLMQILYLTHASEIKGTTRVSASGRIIYTFPETPGAIGADLSSQEHFQAIIQTHQPVLSDVFDSIQGFATIAFHVPVFEDEVFQGSLAVLIPFDQLSRKYLEPIKIGKDGYAWIISRKGVELYCPVPGHIGKSVFENCKDFPTILSMAQEMVKGNRGTTTYFFDRVRGESVESLKKQAVYVPAHIGNTFWSIVVATPEDEVLDILQGFRDRWFLIFGVLMLITVVWTSYVLRAFKILKEEEKRKQAETALKASEEKYRELVENANSIILRRDVSGKVTFFNEFAQRFFGYSEDDILGRNVVGTVVPEIESTGRDLRRMIEDIGLNPDRYVNNINENMRRNGERVWIAWTNKPIRDENGRVVEILCIGNDITERKRAEEKLQESEERLRLTLEAINDGIWDWNITTGDVVFSPRWYSMLGYEPYELPQNYDSWRSLVHREDIDRAEREINAHIASGEGYAIEIRMQTKADGWRWVLTRGRVVERDADGHPIRMVGTHSDITERKRAEDTLRESEERFKKILDSLDVGVTIIDTDSHQITSINPKALALLGASEDQVLGKVCHQYICPAEIGKCPISDLGQGIDASERILLTADSGKLPILKSVVQTKLGGHDCLVESFIDITERKRAEEALRGEKDRAQKYLDIAGIMFVALNAKGELTLINRKASEVLGYEQKEFIGKNWFDSFLPVSIKDQTRTVFYRLMAGEIEPVEYYENPVLSKSGEERIIAWHNTILKDDGGNIIGTLSSGEDITERKRAEEALRESEERWTFALEGAGDGVWDWNVETNEVYYSRQWKAMLGFEEHEIGNTLGEWDQRVHPDDREPVYAEIKKHFEGRSPVYISEHRMRCKDGTYKWILDRGRVISQTPEGNPLRVIGTHTDITERKQAEEERRRLEERLQRAEKMEALGTLAGGVAHDLNNVLGIVVGYSELLLDDLDESSSARSKTMGILKGGQRAAAIVQDLLTLARRGVSNRKVTNLNNVVMEYQNSPEFANLLSYHPNIELKTDFEADLLNMSGSPVHLEKAFINLVSNAAEAMPNGGTLTVKTANCYLDKPISGYDEVREGDYVVLSISDTGQGIPSTDLKRIFEPFYTKKVMGRSGTGLGLAVIWGTVKDHHGYINVQSEEGKGTTFTLYFPVTRQEISQEQVSISAAEYMGNGESILVVDDIREQRELASTMLKKLDYTVVSVSSGEEAVKHLQEHTVDLIVLDMIMYPGMDGLDTYAKILEIHPHQKAVILSGFSETERVAKAQALGSGSYVKKPYVLEKLGLAVRKELDLTA